MIRLQDEVIGDIPSDEEEVPMVQGRGKRTRSDAEVFDRSGVVSPECPKGYRAGYYL
jgi:hypothetical protein